MLRKSFFEYRVLLFVSLTTLFVSILLAISLGARWDDFIGTLLGFGMTLLALYVLFGIAAAVCYIHSGWEVFRNKESGQKSFRHRMEDKANKRLSAYWDSGRLIKGIPALFVLWALFLIVPITKSMISSLHPYQLDPLFSSLDKFLHFGVFPHEIIVPIVDYFSLVPLLEFAYIFWFSAMMAAFWYAVFIDNDKHRREWFLWSFVLTWILMGWGLATGLSSVGPIFFGDFYPDVVNPYEALMTHLKQPSDGPPIKALAVSSLLLEMQHDDNVIDINGISAMPSMHVSIAVLLALYCTKINKILAIAAFLFVGTIILGSVYFAWHYMIDGYAAILGTSLIWVASGCFLRKSAVKNVN